MKPNFYFQILLSLVIVLLISIVALATNEFNITRGSSISTYCSSSPNNNNEPNTTSSTTTSYWLSPSGNIAFGFYPLLYSNSSSSCRFVVGIWFVKSVDKTLVWMANPIDPPLHHPSSLLFNKDGKLILQTIDDGGKDKPLLPLVSEQASHAAMLDNGNFILYGFNSTTNIWESFAYPTNTIFGGQTLKSEQSLISSYSNKFAPSKNKNYELKIKRDDFLLCDLDGERMYDYDYPWPSYCNPQVNKTEKVRPITMKLDSITGRLYIVDNWDLVVKNFTGEGKPQPQQEEQEVVLYRATLDVDGPLRLYKEIIGIGGEKSIVIWQWPKVESAFDKFISSTKGILIITFVPICFCIMISLGFLIYFHLKRKSNVHPYIH